MKSLPPSALAGNEEVFHVKQLWIDDFREPPDRSWLWAKSSAEALAMYGEHRDIGYIAFDYDLGGPDTSMPVLIRIEQDAQAGHRKPPRWNAHTANPVGRNHIETIMSKAMDYWAEHEAGRPHDDPSSRS